LTDPPGTGTAGSVAGGRGHDPVLMPPTPTTAAPGEDAALELAYESGVEIEARSQWTDMRRRFFRHRLAVVSLVILLIVFLSGAFANWVAPYSFDQIDLQNSDVAPTLTGWHLFGTDLIGRDYLSRVIYGIRTTEQVSLLVALISTLVGVTIGAIAGYFSGWVDNALMRFTDLILTLPALAVLLTAAAIVKTRSPLIIALILAGVFWTGFARIVRGTFLSLREKEYVEAAKAAGASDLRIMVRHMLPNAVGPIIVAATLTVGVAILTEAVLAFLGFGVQPPTPALGKLIADGQDAGTNLWWLVTMPGLTIVVIILCVNFVGDGLRDAFDPTQRRIRA
jgi:peptide/nickel transport system permease protein